MQVTEMKKVVEQKQVVVAQAKTDCEELLVQIVQDKRVADEQEKQVRILLAGGSSPRVITAATAAAALVPCFLSASNDRAAAQLPAGYA
jgi:hypothetical protein